MYGLKYMQKEKKVKLLILTQKVDIDDPVLGFFVRWVREFAKHCEKITVICLQKGEYDLPGHVRVLSLGKEEGVSRLRYIIRFYRYLWNERKNYDTVFVHMNQEYVLLGGLIWKCLGKKIALWRNHYAGGLFTRIAMMLSDHVFCTSKYSFTARSKKTTLMPVGIDTVTFTSTGEERHAYRQVGAKNSILFLSRIAPSKNVHMFIEALGLLKKQGVLFSANIYGNALPKDTQYLERLKARTKELGLEHVVHMQSGVPNQKTPEIYNTHEIFVNTSPSGMYDKTIFEAMACEGLVLTSNINLKGSIDNMFLFRENDGEDLARQLVKLLALSPEEKKKLRERLRAFVLSHHSLSLLGDKLGERLAS